MPETKLGDLGMTPIDMPAEYADYLLQHGWIPLNAYGENTGPWIPPTSMGKPCYATTDAINIQITAEPRP